MYAGTHRKRLDTRISIQLIKISNESHKIFASLKRIKIFCFLSQSLFSSLSLPERAALTLVLFGKSIYCCRKFANSSSLPASLPLSAVKSIPSWTYVRDARYKKLKVERRYELTAKSYLPSTFGKKQRKAKVHATPYRSFCYDVKFT